MNIGIGVGVSLQAGKGNFIPPAVGNLVLSMNGINDYLKTPSLTFDKITVDATYKSFVKEILNARDTA